MRRAAPGGRPGGAPWGAARARSPRLTRPGPRRATPR